MADQILFKGSQKNILWLDVTKGSQDIIDVVELAQDQERIRGEEFVCKNNNKTSVCPVGGERIFLESSDIYWCDNCGLWLGNYTHIYLYK